MAKGCEMCLVCGWPGLTLPPYDEQRCASYEICPCCATQFGYDDCDGGAQKVGITHAELRRSWIRGGMRWWSNLTPPPPEWNAASQLAGIWPFDQPRNCATVTVLRVMKGLDPITLVSHEESDHSWQFLNTGNGGTFDMSDAALVSLEEILKRDPTVREVADLPPGWQARRAGPGAPWQRELNPRENVE